jgi:DNA-binding response OmpR family regulator
MLRSRHSPSLLSGELGDIDRSMDRIPRAERTALIVDDDVFVLSALAEVLSEDGYDVHTASNGFSAMRQAREFRPSVILLDLVLPERTGGDVLTELRADPATHDLAVVIVTGHAEGLTETLLSEADGVIAKPFDVDELMTLVQRALQRAACRHHTEVAPVAAFGHREVAPRAHLASAGRRPRGRP